MAHPAVIPTSPAKAPLRAILTSGLPKCIQTVIIAAIAPAAAAKLVVTAITAMLIFVPLVVLPALKPNQPNHNMNTPKAAMGIL